MEKRTQTDVRARRKRIRRKRILIALFVRTAAVLILIGIIIAAGLLLRGCSRTVREASGKDVSAQERIESTADEPQEVRILHDNPKLEELEFPFNQMSADWGSGDLDGWWRYEIPEKYSRTGGYLPDLVQVYAYCLCRQQGIDYPMLLALIEVESGYQYDVVSSAGDIGYMQVNYKWQKDKMEGLKEKALYSPYVNIQVGIRYLAELSETFDTNAAILTAYKYGPGGAYSRCFNDPEITSEYAEKVLAVAARIDDELFAREETVNATCIEIK